MIKEMALRQKLVFLTSVKTNTILWIFHILLHTMCTVKFPISTTKIRGPIIMLH